ncbi:MAG: hypothetical protein AB7L70_01775 [Pyrinomonadaceae bacterium]
MLRFSRLVSLGFCSGGFSSTAGYVPGNEAQLTPKSVERRSTDQADHFLMALSVFIPTTPAVCPEGSALASLSASAPSVSSSGFPLLLLSNYASPHQFHLSVPVKVPLSNLDCEAILHHLNSMSSRNYFNFRLFLQ